MSTILEALSQNININKDKCVFCARCVETCLLDNIRLKIAPCRRGCPLDLNCHGYVQLLARGQDQAALELVRETLPFPGLLGRICHHPCEEVCSRREVDREPVAVRELKRYLADRVDYAKPPEPIRERGGRVAVIGGGPAGAYAACLLRQRGYQVTVYEAGSRLGGMAASAIPAFRLPDRVVAQEFSVLAELGVRVIYNTAVGRDVRLGELIRDHNAVLIATGAGQGKKLNLLGEAAVSVYNALDFLRAARLAADKPRVGARTVVIGGGNTAMDAAQTALRLGAQDVRVFCLEGRREMPAFAWEVAEAEEEGVGIESGWGPARFTVEGGQVKALEFQRCLSVFDDRGRFSPVFAEGETMTAPADTVIVAIGQQADLGFLGGTGLAIANGRLTADPVTMATNLLGVFAAGDVASGPKSVVEALAQGREAAESIHRRLNGLPLAFGRDRLAGCITDYAIDYGQAKPASRAQPDRLLPDQRRHSFQEIAAPLTAAQAQQEASRCLSCGEPWGKYRTCWFCLACEVDCPQEAIDVAVPYLMR